MYEALMKIHSSIRSPMAVSCYWNNLLAISGDLGKFRSFSTRVQGNHLIFGNNVSQKI